MKVVVASIQRTLHRKFDATCVVVAWIELVGCDYHKYASQVMVFDTILSVIYVMSHPLGCVLSLPTKDRLIDPLIRGCDMCCGWGLTIMRLNVTVEETR